MSTPAPMDNFDRVMVCLLVFCALGIGFCGVVKSDEVGKRVDKLEADVRCITVKPSR